MPDKFRYTWSSLLRCIVQNHPPGTLTFQKVKNRAPRNGACRKTDLTTDFVLLQKKTQHSNEERCLAQEFVNCTYLLDNPSFNLKYLSQVAYLI